jgi:uridylate kinase
MKRVLLKISGEMLLGSQPFGINQSACREVASSLHEMQQSGLQVAIVIGGGNIFRGINLKESGMARTPADNMGMLATLMNGISLQQALKSMGSQVHLMTALECPKVAESYQWEKAIQYLDEGKLLIFVGGTGNPYFTTDSAAALRASEIQAEVLLKATKVDGVYDKDPHKYPEAKRYTEMTYTQYLKENLAVMDSTAVALCMNNKIPIFVFNMNLLGKKGVSDLLSQPRSGTLIKGDHP